MTDHDAMEAVNAVIEQYRRTQITSTEALNYIDQISSANKIEHREAKPQ